MLINHLGNMNKIKLDQFEDISREYETGWHEEKYSLNVKKECKETSPFSGNFTIYLLFVKLVVKSHTCLHTQWDI